MTTPVNHSIGLGANGNAVINAANGDTVVFTNEGTEKVLVNVPQQFDPPSNANLDPGEVSQTYTINIPPLTYTWNELGGPTVGPRNGQIDIT